jgi:hypothetical protein
MNYVPGDGLRAMDALRGRRQVIFDLLSPERQKAVTLMMWQGEARLFALPLIFSTGFVSLAGFRSPFGDHTAWSYMVAGFAALGIFKVFVFTEGCQWAYRLRISWREWPLMLSLYAAVPLIEFVTWKCDAWRHLYFQIGVGCCFVLWFIVWIFLSTKIPPEMDL